MRAYLVFIISAALCLNCLAKDIRRGSTRQVRANSVWFADKGNLTHWQQLKKSGDASALASYQDEVLSQRDAWQFLSPHSVKILSYLAARKQIKVEMTTEGRMRGTKWWLDSEALAP